MEGIGSVVAGDHVERVAVLDGHPFESLAELLRELILRIAQLFGHQIHRNE